MKEDLFDIRLEKAELEQTVAGTLTMLPSLERRRLTAFQNTHANNQDMLGIAHVVLHALQTRAAIKEGRSLHVAHLHHTGTELQFGKNIFAKLKKARAKIVSCWELVRKRVLSWRTFSQPTNTNYKMLKTSSI